MTGGVDLSQFYDTFFDEADELLANMEQLLLGLDIEQPDIDQLNGIFRAAHSIKGGAGTFGCFGQLAETTHLLENLLDLIRVGEMPLRKGMIDLFLETKDVLAEQVASYRNGDEPDVQSYERICAQLRQLALDEQQRKAAGAAASASPTPVVQAEAQVQASEPPQAGEQRLHVAISGLSDKDAQSLLDEMALMGTVRQSEVAQGVLSLVLDTTATADDIQAVCCFVVNEDQIKVSQPGAQPAADTVSAPPEPAPAVAPTPVASTPAPEPRSESRKADAAKSASASSASSSTLRVGVEKVDQIINLVGELVITQAMLVQTVSTLDPVLHDRLLNGIEQLERNARDLQEAVMSIRMMPMDYVFSRFPRVVRENAARMDKQIRLITRGQATELDKSLIERIIDPLTHLVRNSIDHGIEPPAVRRERGKPEEGTITLSAQHNGGQIVIEIADDGGGLDRDRILNKAIKQGFPVSEHTPDEELWQLIFAPGFSTAEQVTDISGRGVGMDVVRRNIQGMGGHVHLSSRAGQGTVTRIVLPLTLAILDGMSVKVGEETFILPLSNVMESMQPSQEQVRQVSETERVLHVRGEYLPIVALHDIFAVDGAVTDLNSAIAVILQAEDMRFALMVDHLIGQHQVVVKNLEANYRKIPGVSAATILGDGSVALIVDVFALVRVTRDRNFLAA